MKLISFRVTKFRNVVDSGVIAVDPRVTCLVGKNEAGKSGLLEALYLFNPAYGETFEVNDQYPRWLVVQDRRTGKLEEHAPISVTFDLDVVDRDTVTKALGPGVLISDQITVDKRYNGGEMWAVKWSEEAAIKNLVDSAPSRLRPFLSGVTTLTALKSALEQVEPDQEDGPTAADLEAAGELIAEWGLDNTGSTDV